MFSPRVLIPLTCSRRDQTCEHTLHAERQHTRSTAAYILPSCKLPVEVAVLLHHALGLLFKVLSRVIAPPVEHVTVLVKIAPCEETKWHLRVGGGGQEDQNWIRTESDSLNYMLGSHRCRRSRAWSRVRWPFLFRRSWGPGADVCWRKAAAGFLLEKLVRKKQNKKTIRVTAAARHEITDTLNWIN